MASTIIDDLPTHIEMQLTKSLNEVLAKENLITIDEDLSLHRVKVLTMLNNLFKEWTREVSMVRDLPNIIKYNVGGLFCTFGSYRLGVHHKDDDIDVIIIVPRHITRVDYFSTFYNKLKKNPAIRYVRAIETAFVPVIKMVILGIEIDMLFASLDLKEVDKNINLERDDLLRNLNAKCVRSLNGCRVANSILRLVPNRKTFQKTLIVIKLWAKRKRVYSSILGYLGGISWAILVARICQLYPNSTPVTLVRNFFVIFSKWDWRQPVLLQPLYRVDLGYPVWDSKTNKSDSTHVMPIITPVYPQQNSTYNVSKSTLNIVRKEFKTSLNIITRGIIAGEFNWTTFFQPSKFFTKYKYFLSIIVLAKCDEDLFEWRGFVKSKLRFLPVFLERDACVRKSHLNPDQFVLPAEMSQGKPSSVWFIGLETTKCNGKNANLDLSTHIRDFCLLLIRTRTKARDGMEIQVNHLKQKDLKDYVPNELNN
ncbi:Poly(A) polymerase,Poly(A) polymerase, RNA-binding domain,Nucleotidyltransferase, class I, C-terminal- [Cinara cedri]|uniref:Poly(A) polymerase n=1 Tax=Cinara cedri TaxID=506608 RepID=A0A5E4M4T6_9HEMI|nr:Poly(A) polymerase,Poly(A) polymerase, RNA-binding domain,Nucleotidyltransferase, class I, C-terminal- [Cinara cedri]